MVSDVQDFLSHPNWAVIGVSTDTTKYGNKVYFQLKNAGYRVYAVNPKLENIAGEPCYPNLASIPIKPNAVSIVVPPKVTEQIIKECIKLGIKRVWMQPGSENQQAIEEGEKNGLSVIHNQCILKQLSGKSI